MATVTGFEGLRHPRKSDLRQFSELFEPLFSASSDEARRQAAAALSQCDHVPSSVALQIGSAPIAIAALFLTRAPQIDDITLISVIRSQSTAHATAIARRENLSVRVVDALVERRQTITTAPRNVPTASPLPTERVSEAGKQENMVIPQAEIDRQSREEKLRSDIKALARIHPNASPSLALQPVSPFHEALLIRFARSGEVNLFASTLSATIGASLDLAEHIVLDVSGLQLATTLSGLAMPQPEAVFVLSALYPHLAERFGPATRADALMASLPQAASRSRVESWLKSEKDRDLARHEAYLAPERGADPRAANTHTQKKMAQPLQSTARTARR